MVLICVEKYEHPNYLELPGTQVDLQRLSSLFADEYKYKVYKNDKPRVT